MNKLLLVVLPALCCSFLQAEFVTDLDKGWRLTVGPQFDFNASGRLGVKASAVPRPAPSYSGNKSAAQAAGDSIALGNGRTDFPNGGYVDPSDSAGKPGETWNWHVPAGQLHNGHMAFEHAYVERSTVYDLAGGSARDDSWSTGASFGLDRKVWRKGDFGVDIGFNFSFFIRDNWYRREVGGLVRTDTTRTGSYNTDVDMGNANVLNDPWARNPDGSYGSGSFDGPGPVVSMGDMSVAHRWGPESVRSTSTSYGPFSVRGDLQMYEFQLALKPYYDLTESFMLRGSLGVGLDYRKFDAEMDGFGKDSSRDWDCHMLCGVGGMYHHGGFCLGVDFLRKVFDDDLHVDTDYVEGSVRSSNWILRAYVGYEF